MAASTTVPLVEQFRETLADCRRLYVDGARRCAERFPHLLDESPDEFVQLMDDLHRGLLIKIHVTVAHADRHWSVEEQRLAESLFEHVWGRRLRGDNLREALRHVIEQSPSLSWPSLFNPFEQIAPLGERLGELETVVMRLANIVAKADGRVCDAEKRNLLAIQAELDRLLRTAAPKTAPPRHADDDRRGAQAVRNAKSDARQVRGEMKLEKRPEPAPAPRDREQLLAEARAELDELVGLDSIKQEVLTLLNFLRVQEARAKAGLPRSPLSLHMVFCGNPGTGKTTVARIVGKILGAMGILKQGHLVETDRSGLVAEYAGQTGPKTNKKVDEALDGVLFIDEAYSLVATKGDDPYGNEAVQALLKRMEDDRERLVVALAGYPAPMDRLLKSNPGLSSRFNRTFQFPDYTAAELGQVFALMCGKSHYQLPTLVRVKLLLGFQSLLARRDEHFGNGRLARNVFELATRNLANRIVNVAPITRELLTTFMPEDIAMPDVPASAWQDLDRADRRFATLCSACRAKQEIVQEKLGARCRCASCQAEFAAEWGEPLA